MTGWSADDVYYRDWRHGCPEEMVRLGSKSRHCWKYELVHSTPRLCKEPKRNCSSACQKVIESL